jgi:hypothetical protein
MKNLARKSLAWPCGAAPFLPWFAGADSWFQAGALAGGRAAGLVTEHTCTGGGGHLSLAEAGTADIIYS